MNEKQPAVDPAATAFDDYSDVVLYDVMDETGTRLGGTLVALYDRAKESCDEAGARHWHRGMQRERKAVRGTDREAQVSAITAWRDEMAARRPFLPNS